MGKSSLLMRSFPVLSFYRSISGTLIIHDFFYLKLNAVLLISFPINSPILSKRQVRERVSEIFYYSQRSLTMCSITLINLQTSITY
jgi:hypothetical protein